MVTSSCAKNKRLPLSSVPSRPQVNYMIYQKEKGGGVTEYEHWQIYIQFKNPQYFTACQRLIGDNTAHCEPQFAADNTKCRAYCSKEEGRLDGPYEHGEFVQGNMTQEVELLQDLQKRPRIDWAFLEKHASVLSRRHTWSKAVIENGPNYLVPFYNQPAEEEVEERDPPEVWYIYGPTGVGKTRWVHRKEPNVYEVTEPQSGSQWYDGYAGRPAVLFDEFVGQYPIRQLNKLLDPYFRRTAVKGGFTEWKPTRIYFTSNYNPVRCYRRSMETRRPTVESFIRRITHYIEVNVNDKSFNDISHWSSMTIDEKIEYFQNQNKLL